MRQLSLLIVLIALAATTTTTQASGIRLKELARIEGVRDNALIGYGLVVGLSGTGDSSRNRATVQSLVNTLANFGVMVEDRDIASRNAAAVMVTATLPPFAEPGNRIDVHVSSMSDARSLSGGTLLLTPLHGPDERLYALAQGSLATGGYRFESFDSSVQKNHPSVGVIPDGATIERGLENRLTDDQGKITVVLNEPDFTTAQRVTDALSRILPEADIRPTHAGRVELDFGESPVNPVGVIARIENVTVMPDNRARIVVDERSGTVVAGGNTRIADVSISHGDLRVVVETDFQVSQPSFIGRNSDSVQTAVVPDTEIEVTEEGGSTVSLEAGTTVGEMVSALRRINLSTRDIITILRAIKRAGSLHGELVIQ